jgi:hypothetical protein
LAESRAGQCKHFDIERAAAHLHGMLGALMRTTAERRYVAVPGARRPPA